METKLWLALREDINRLIPIVARRNNCTDNDVVNLMDVVVNEWNEKNEAMQSSLRGSYQH